MGQSFKRETGRVVEYCRDTSGQFAMMFAFLAFPIIIALAYVSDMTYAGKIKAELEGSLDAAVLAAVVNQTLTEQERGKFAVSHFKENFEYFDMFKVSVVDASSERVELSASGGFPSYIGAITGRDTFDLSAASTSVLTSENVICMMALDPYSEKAIEFKGDSTLNARACSVQVNSRHKNALYADNNHPPVAKQFCSTGGSHGQFSGTLKHECAVIGDPYKSLPMPAEPFGCHDGTIKRKTVLSPSQFCNGLKIDGADVYLRPGIYHIWGELLITGGASVKGNGVTLILRGKEGRLKIDNDSSVDLKAPATGPTKGLVFWQSPHNGSNVSSTEHVPNEASGKSEIDVDGDISITGTAYFPTHELIIKSKRSVSSHAPATSFIAYRIMLDGDVNLIINVDHEKGGIPPLLPRSDEGARLIE